MRCFRWTLAVLAPLSAASLLTAQRRSMQVQAASTATPSRRTTVLADGGAHGQPDSATFHIGVEGSSTTPRAALHAANSQIDKALELAHGFGIEDADLQTAGLSLYPVYARSTSNEDNPPPITGYRASNTVTVMVRDLTEVNLLPEAVADAGVSDLSRPEFGIQDATSLHALALADAVRRARPLAEAAAQAGRASACRVRRSPCKCVYRSTSTWQFSSRRIHRRQRSGK